MVQVCVNLSNSLNPIRRELLNFHEKREIASSSTMVRTCARSPK